MDIPSLFMIPSAVSSGKVHSVFPNSTDADFDFNRDSDATRVNSEGLIERVGYYGSELVTNGDFDTDTNWSKTSGAIISNGKATITVTGGGYQSVAQSISLSNTKKYRVTAVVNGTSGKAVTFVDNSANNGGLTTSNGVITFNGQDQNVDITWTANSNSFEIEIIRNGSGDFSFTVDSVSVKELIGDRARLNYEIEGGLVNTKPSLLLEPQSTNLLAYSEDFSDYTTTNVTVTHNQGTSPDGLNNAAKMLMSSGTGTHRIFENISSSLSDNNTFSVFIKEQSEVSHIGLNADTASDVAWFNGANGSIINANGLDAKTQSFGNGWHRISVSYVADSNDSSDNQFVYFSNREFTTPNVAFKGTESVLMYGFQAEKQSYCTSYIPTNGSTQTRAAETCNGAGTSSIFESSEGILYAEYAALADDGSIRYLGLSDGGSSNRVVILNDSTNNNIRGIVSSGGTKYADFGFVVPDVTTFNKVALKWKFNNFQLWINGVKRTEDLTGLAPIGLDRFDFSLGGSGPIDAKIRDIRVYNTKEMTDSEVDILLTKITS